MPNVFLPRDEAFASRDAWQNPGKNIYTAVQAQVVIIQRRGNNVLTSPPSKVLNLPTGAVYSNQIKITGMTRNVGDIQQSIQSTVTRKFSSKIAERIAFEIGTGGVLPTAKLSGGLQSDIGKELTAATQGTLSQHRSFEYSLSEENTTSISLKPSSQTGTTKYHFYLGLWPWSWDYYLYQIRYMTLFYKRHLFWLDVRKTIEKGDTVLSLPLFRVRFYEPQAEFSIETGDYQPDVAGDVKEVKIEPLADPMPEIGTLTGRDLESLAALAFPTSWREKTSAATYPGARWSPPEQYPLAVV